VTRPSLIQVIHRLEDLLEGLHLSRSYGGAIAYNYFGPPRLTQDVDVLVLVPDTRIPALVEALTTAGFVDGGDGSPIDLRIVLTELRAAVPSATSAAGASASMHRRI